MKNLNLSDELIKDFIYSMYRKEVLLNLKGVVLTEEDRNKLHKKRDFVNSLSQADIEDIRSWILNKLKTLENRHN
ncbi:MULTISPECIES: hypothetical protein [unclassified Gilliamella]|uniref:hypothetical protein n=1 Tax=unclassified Gilliamella TaxID=2685620 RepID=UPI001C69F3D7|nr:MULTISPECIES: hypothetical protein [unclassified Gilliamella]MCX8602456.1 hypothetical protein [Gilliamella sp. B3722]MCX8608039.1 hypothetical protein [Gilliamella sp. B3771]MCX8611615.1 hypothetical protein [Gilliamella sp. B3891]MCX8614117.1 hypothetical protein [Gilliamella sp. B3773]MCX8618249.1 hypothetical protein [Gilliamella sp. B2923]